MNIHKNARLTPRSRADLVRRVVEEGQAPKAVATAFGVSIKTVGKGPGTPISEVMTRDVKYCFDDEDIGHVILNIGENQVRRLPVMNREKRLVGIVTLADAALEHDPVVVGEALLRVVEPGGDHCQSAA